MRSFFKKYFPQILIALVIFFAGWQLGFSGYQLNLKLNPPSLRVENKRVTSGSIDFSPLWDVLDRINADYLFRPVDGTKLLYGAISGLVKALGDPYTAFLNPTENAEFNDSLEGVYEGIGAELGVRKDQLIIVAPLSGSPAVEVGVRAGDKILEIDGSATVGLSVTEAVSKIRGKAGTVVGLTLQRGSDPSFKVSITRARITVKSVNWEEKGSGIYYLKVSRFGESTNGEWDEAVRAIKQQAIGSSLKGVVLDLRNSPGGYLSGAVYLASEFLKSGPVVIQEDASGDRSTLSVQLTKGNHALAGIPVVVLIDEGSASASEILAAALKERAGAKLVGEKSFGKGTVQDAVDFDDGSGLHLSVAKWLTPKGLWVHDRGLEPDFKVALTDEDINAGRDPQLDRAIELLR
ncbi:MAG: S41 family peptidase [candidate division WWE3 bacterium]|nr:S41 family peptidase [candidate division WWE3 bacterium]